MSRMASQITSLTIVYSTVYSRCRSRKTSKLHVTGLCEGNSPVTGEFPAQRASNAENVSIWWRHHESVVRLRCSVNVRLNHLLLSWDLRSKMTENKTVSALDISLYFSSQQGGVLTPHTSKVIKCRSPDVWSTQQKCGAHQSFNVSNNSTHMSCTESLWRSELNGVCIVSVGCPRTHALGRLIA